MAHKRQRMQAMQKFRRIRVLTYLLRRLILSSQVDTGTGSHAERSDTLHRFHTDSIRRRISLKYNRVSLR